MITLQKIEHGVSSMIKGIWYCLENQQMFVKFSNGGSVYRVDNIDKEIADLFVEEGEKLDGSVGKLYHKVIRSQPNLRPATCLTEEQLVELPLV